MVHVFKIFITLIILILLSFLGIISISRVWKIPINCNSLLNPSVSGLILTFFSIILAIIFFSKTATLNNQLESLNNQVKILTDLTEAQSDRNKKFHETLKGIDKQIILGSTIEWVKIRVYFNGEDDYEGSQFYFWFFKVNVFDIKMFLDLPGTFNVENFPIRAKNVQPENYILFDRWVAHKTDINTKDVYHRLSTHGYKKNKFVIGELYVDPNDLLRRLNLTDFNKSYLKILVNEKAKNYLQKIELILNNSIVFKAIPDECIIEEVNNFNDYPDKLNPENIYNDKWFLIGIQASHTIGTGPFEINLY